MTLKLLIDGTEKRVKTPTIAETFTILHDGEIAVDLEHTSQTVFIEPIKGTAILSPYPARPDFATTASSDPNSNYYRVPLAATNRAGSATWRTHIRDNVANNAYLYNTGSSEYIETLESYEKNRSYWLSWFSFGDGGRAEQISVMIGDIKFSCTFDGRASIFKGDLMIGSGTISTLKGSNFSQTDTAQSAPRPNNVISCAIIPCRHREILVLFTNGGGFFSAVPDISEDEPNPIIIPPGKIRASMSGQTMVQFAPIRFSTGGDIYSNEIILREPPADMSTYKKKVYSDPPLLGTGSTTLTFVRNLSTDFVGDGTSDTGRFRAQLQGNGKSSPNFYGASIWFETATADTSDEERDIADYLMSVDLSVREGESAELSIITSKPTELEQTSKNWLFLPRHIKLVEIVKQPDDTDREQLIFEGRTEQTTQGEASTDPARRTPRNCYDYLHWLGRGQILNPIPFDGWELTDALVYLLKSRGLEDGNISIEDFEINIEGEVRASEGDFKTLFSVGSSEGDGIEQLIADYAANALYTQKYTPSGYKVVIESFPSSSEMVTVYLSENEGKKLAQSYQQAIPLPEANILRVTGIDPMTNTPFQVVMRDAESADATLPVALRPINWLGEPVSVGLFNPAIRSVGEATRIAELLSERLFQARREVDIETRWQRKADGSPVWVGDRLEVIGCGGTNLGIHRVVGIKARFENEHKGIRPATYTCEWRPEDQPVIG